MQKKTKKNNIAKFNNIAKIFQNGLLTMSEDELLTNFEGITLRLEVNTNIPKVTAVRLLISLAANFESKDQVSYW